MLRKRVTSLIGTFFLLASSSVFAWEDMTAEDAHACAVTDPNCFILDVRTNGEWRWVGHPGINKLGDGELLEGKVVNISWLIIKRNQLVTNKRFLWDVRKEFRDIKDEVTLITMCRSGSRSEAAADALEAAGYPQVYNMLNGFEGGRDASGYRTVNGWKVEGYPYNDSSDGGYRK